MIFVLLAMDVWWKLSIFLFFFLLGEFGRRGIRGQGRSCRWLTLYEVPLKSV